MSNFSSTFKFVSNDYLFYVLLYAVHITKSSASILFYFQTVITAQILATVADDEIITQLLALALLSVCEAVRMSLTNRAAGWVRFNKNNTLLHKNTKHVHVLGLEGHVHDTNTRPKTNCATTIEENIYKSNSRVEQSNDNYISKNIHVRERRIVHQMLSVAENEKH